MSKMDKTVSLLNVLGKRTCLVKFFWGRALGPSWKDWRTGRVRNDETENNLQISAESKVILSQEIRWSLTKFAGHKNSLIKKEQGMALSKAIAKVLFGAFSRFEALCNPFWYFLTNNSKKCTKREPHTCPHIWIFWMMIKNYSKLVLLGCSVHAEEMLAQNTSSMQQILGKTACGFCRKIRSSNSLNQKKDTHMCVYNIYMYIY